MKSTEILDLFARFEAAASEYEGVECWSARELQRLLGYSKWENFFKVIEKAKESCANAGEKEADHFPDVRKTIPMPKGAEKEINDLLLTRYACYLIAQNGDSRKLAFESGKLEEDRCVSKMETHLPDGRKYDVGYYNLDAIQYTHTCPSFAYPNTKQEIATRLDADKSLRQDIDRERETMDRIFSKLQEGQNRITDWYYGHFHQHKLETHHGINFRLCDCSEVNEFRGYRHKDNENTI